MVSEHGANWCTKVKVDEATDYRIGASNLQWFTGSEGQLLKCRERIEKCFTVGLMRKIDEAASSENQDKNYSLY
jgi:hypothetical protein